MEVHIELNTRTKMFCRCSADYFGKEPNSHTCPVCLGLPGALPYINEEAIKKCMQIGLALNCSVNEESYFERKNYFYPDLVKGYQISQLVKPLNVGGWIMVNGSDGKEIKIRINRAHQEEDTAKLTHQLGISKIDFNRSGVPLVEIVTEPDFHSSAEVRDYAQKLREIFRHIGVSNADMERGDMRLEANVSVRRVNSEEKTMNSQEKPLPPYRVELKNINSFRFMVAAIEYEIKRQIEALERGEKLTQETRGWNESKKETFLQRSKEEAHDYRYFPEPDLPELRVKLLESRVKEEISGKLPHEKVGAFVDKYGVSEAQAAALIKQCRADLFEQTVSQREKGEAPKIANLIINAKDARDLTASDILQTLRAKTEKLEVDETIIENAISQTLSENESAVNNYKKGNQGSLQFLLGQILKKTKGRGNPSEIREKLVAKVSEKS